MTNLAPHPGRAPEFLSRLHDGDLTAAERAQFESHRAHCSECRKAAAEFEAALALFRSSRPKPPGPDLSARILRKLQAANSRRSPFGVTFGIDLRWAGAFAAALIAVIIGTSVVARREAAERKSTTANGPIPVVMEQDKRKAEAQSLEESRARQEVKQNAAPPAASSPSKDAGRTTHDNDEFAQSPPSRNQLRAAQKPAAPPAPAVADRGMSARRDTESRSSARPSEPKSEAAPSLQRKPESSAFAERAGGEGGANANIAADKIATRPRLEVLALDGAGAPPLLLDAEKADVPLEFRGREFRLVVEASGRVREVKPVEQRLRKKAKLGREQAPAEEAATAADAKEVQPLKDLVFQSGDRPRVLRVRVE